VKGYSEWLIWAENRILEGIFVAIHAILAKNLFVNKALGLASRLRGIFPCPSIVKSSTQPGYACGFTQSGQENLPQSRERYLNKVIYEQVLRFRVRTTINNLLIL
jgi:hypothetical protein